MTATPSLTPDCEHIEVGWGERRTIAALQRTARRVLRIEVRPSGAVVVFAPFDKTFREHTGARQKEGFLGLPGTRSDL